MFGTLLSAIPHTTKTAAKISLYLFGTYGHSARAFNLSLQDSTTIVHLWDIGAITSMTLGVHTGNWSGGLGILMTGRQALKVGRPTPYASFFGTTPFAKTTTKALDECTSRTSCLSCAEALGCGWCNGQCTPGDASGPIKAHVCGKLAWTTARRKCPNTCMIPAAALQHTCGKCIAQVSCGWCASSNTCMLLGCQTSSKSSDSIHVISNCSKEFDVTVSTHV